MREIETDQNQPTPKAPQAQLTAKQEAFALAYLESGNASIAYRRAYNAEEMGNQSVAVTACRLLQNPKIALRVQAARDRILDEIVWSRQQSVRTLRDIATGLDRTTTCQARIAAVKELNAMFGYNAPVKSQVLGADGQPANLKITVKFVAPGAAGSVG